MPDFIRIASLNQTIRNVRNADFQRAHISMEMPEAWQMPRRSRILPSLLKGKRYEYPVFMMWKAA